MPARFYTAPAQENLLTQFSELPPVFGMDDNVPLHNMPEGTAVYLYNMTPGAYGNETRAGYQRWAQSLAGTAVKSLIPFNDNTAARTNSRLFAVTQLGIYDVTAAGQTNPPLTVTFPIQTSDAGFTSYVHYTDPAGKLWLLVADSRNGMYEYDYAGPTWTKLTTEITGVDPSKVAFLMEHKGRIWMVERDTSDAWYLPVGQKAGVATKFQLGSKFRHGGELVGCFTWSVDGGKGLDDYFVAMSRAGDVLAYEGTDPAFSNTWGLRGSWYVGDLPKGRRVAFETGGDLIILSIYGMTSMNSLLEGIEPTKVERNVTGKVSGILQREIKAKLNSDYWQPRLMPEEEVIIINVPTGIGEAPIQFALNLNRTAEGSGGAWGLWRDLPAIVFESYNGKAYFGTEDGRVCVMQGSVDDVQIDGTGGSPIVFSILSRFTDFGARAVYKQVQFIRPTFLSANVVNFSTKAVYDFDLIEEASLGGVPSLSGSKWDVDKWDKAVWSGTRASSVTVGGQGYGRSAGIAIKGSINRDTTLVNIEGAWQPWSFL